MFLTTPFPRPLLSRWTPMQPPESDADRFLEEAREEADYAELQGESSLSLYREREEAEGFELFESAEAVLAGSALRDGEPGREGLSADRLGPLPDEAVEEQES